MNSCHNISSTAQKEVETDKPVVIKVDLDAKCKRCGKGGATQSGVCLPCINKAIKNGEFDHIFKKYKPNTTPRR